MIRKTIFFLILGMILVSTSSFAQHKKAFGGMGFFKPGVQFFTPNNISDHLPGNLPNVSYSSLSPGGGGYAVLFNFILGAESGGFEPFGFEGDTHQIDISGSYSSMQIGYLALKKKKLMMYPLLGYNSNTLDLYIHTVDGATNFSDVVGNTQRSTFLTYSASNLNLSLNAIYFLSGMSDSGGGGFALGIQAGYQFPALTSSWSEQTLSITDGPYFPMSGFYFRLMIGGGGIGFRIKGS